MVNSFPRPAQWLALSILAAAAALPSVASAGDVSWSITVGSPRSAVPVYAPPPVVYVQPEPVYVTPRPVYVQPPTVYVQPAPVVVGTPLYAYDSHRGHHGHKQHWKHRPDRHERRHHHHHRGHGR